MWRALSVLSVALVLTACGSTGPRTIQLGLSCIPGDSLSVCASGLCVALDNQSGFCTDKCTADDQCPADFLCQAAGRYGRICRPLVGCKTEVDCPSGHTCNADTGNCYIAVSRALCSARASTDDPNRPAACATADSPKSSSARASA